MLDWSNAIVPKPDDVSHQNKPRRAVHIGIIRVLLSDRSDVFTLPLAALRSVCFDFLLSPLVVAPIVCIYRTSYICYSCIVCNDGCISVISKR